MLRAVVGAVIIVALLAGPGFGQGAGVSQTSHLRVEWETLPDRDGRPVVAGFVHNDSGNVAGEVVLVVEALDRAGRVIARGHHQLPGTVPSFGRDYFSLPVPVRGATYRVSAVAGFFRGGGA
jgi:hypothetical protein